MIEKLISYQTAVLMKEKNIKLTAEYFYIDTGELCLIDEKIIYFLDENLKTIKHYYDYNGDFFWDENGDFVDKIKYHAVTQSLLQKFIREIHKINIEVIGFVDSPEETTCYFYHLRDMTKYSTLLILPDSDENTFDTYEECLENGLYKSLTLIK